MATSAASSSSTAPQAKPLVATGDWTKNLVHLAKTAELKKHALTLQLHTAHKSKLSPMVNTPSRKEM